MMARKRKTSSEVKYLHDKYDEWLGIDQDDGDANASGSATCM